jgi:glycerophosphoryl diester phosphodiesterase
VLRILVALMALFAVVAFLLNTRLLAPSMQGKPVLLAHRGMAQTFPPEGIESDTCTASRIRTPDHSFIENTIPSMRAAFAAGADIVEFDVQPTTDGNFAVFHDWTLDCRTNGRGVTREKTLADLKGLDIGYGYTADGGATFPFRGQGVGLMPTLDEVLAEFPDKRFLIHVKSRDAEEGRKLAARLATLSPGQRARLTVYGHDSALAGVHETLPDMRTLGRRSLMSCYGRYLAIGWSGHVPAACRNKILLVPSNLAWVLWGWPNRFLARMHRAGTEAFLLGPYTGGEFSTGIDWATDVGQLPEGYSGGIWTNRIGAIAPLVGKP